ncbi:MAG: toprim domain-containing protein [Planctomycetota bacterium]
MITPSLCDIKHDLTALIEILEIERAGNHCPCRFCGDKTALSVFNTNAGWRFNCHRCSVSGSIIDAVALAEGFPVSTAIKFLTGSANPPRRSIRKTLAIPPKNVEPQPPVPNTELLCSTLDCVSKTLQESAESQAQWLNKRGIPLQTARVFRLGFMPRVSFPQWKYPLENTWVIPISNANGNVLAMKLHREHASTGPKCIWAPLGTEPKEQPRHGWSTLWPPPEFFWPNDDFEERAAIMEYEGGLSRSEAERNARIDIGNQLPWLYLCPGELKALAVIGAGLQATSITSGESHKWTPGMLSRLNNRRVCIVFDDDNAGHKFREGSLASLRSHGIKACAITFGRKA